MKKFKLCAALLVLLGLFTAIQVSAGDTAVENASIAIESKSVAVKTGETFTVDVSITNNPGIVTATIPVVWDTDVLELTDVTDVYTVLQKTEGCSGWLGTDDYSYAQDRGVYYLAWENDLATQNYTGDGTLCTMVFKVKEQFNSTDVSVQMEKSEHIYPIANIMNAQMDDLQNTFTYEASTLTAGKTAFTFSGKVTSYGSKDNDVVIEMFRENNNTATPDYSTVVKGNNAEYSISGVLPGTYTVKVSKANHISNTHKIVIGSSDLTKDLRTYMLGDLNGDGQINARDARYTLRFAVGYTDEGIIAACGDVNRDKIVNARDARYILRHAVGYDDGFNLGE